MATHKLLYDKYASKSIFFKKKPHCFKENQRKGQEGTHKSADSCTSSAAWKNPSFCHCSNPPGAAMAATTTTLDQINKQTPPNATNSRVSPSSATPAAPISHASKRDLKDQPRNCAKPRQGGDCGRVSLGVWLPGLPVASRRGSGRRRET